MGSEGNQHPGLADVYYLIRAILVQERLSESRARCQVTLMLVAHVVLTVGWKTRVTSQSEMGRPPSWASAANEARKPVIVMVRPGEQGWV